MARPIEWGRWLGWTVVAVAISFGVLAATGALTNYTMTGGNCDCISVGSSASDVLHGLTQILAVALCGRKGPKALWTGIVTTNFVQVAPAAAMMAWAAVAIPIPIERPLNSAVFWWMAGALISTGSIIWLRLKREGPSPREMTASAIMSVILLWFLSLRWDDFHINPILPWKTFDQIFQL
ncbi:hypothetical protein JJE73_29825 [Comamonas sp. JC664]|nr:hypothetical protein [Comamonas sp. JC664]